MTEVYVVIKTDWYSGGYERQEPELIACTSSLKGAINLVCALDSAFDWTRFSLDENGGAVGTISEDDEGTTYRIYRNKVLET